MTWDMQKQDHRLLGFPTQGSVWDANAVGESFRSFWDANAVEVDQSIFRSGRSERIRIFALWDQGFESRAEVDVR